MEHLQESKARASQDARTNERDEMTKELELTPAPAKRSRDEAIALKHLTRQRDKLIARRAAITKTIEKLDASILPLE